jgi:heat shock protein HspQ
LAKQAREEASKPLTEEQKQERIGRRNALAAMLIEERVRDSYLRNEFNEHQTEMLEYYNSLEIEEDKIVAADFIINGYFQQGYKCRDSESKDVRKKLFTEILKHGKLTKQQMEILVKADRDTILELIPGFSEHNPEISMQLGAALKSCKIREERSAPYIEILKENQNWNNQQKKYIAEKYFTDDKEFMEMCKHNKLVFEGESLKYNFQIKNDYDKLNTFLKEEKASYPIIDMFNLKQEEDRDDR